MPKKVYLKASGYGTLENAEADAVKAAFEQFMQVMQDSGFAVRADMDFSATGTDVPEGPPGLTAEQYEAYNAPPPEAKPPA